MSQLVWITGLSGSGKSTIGKEVYKKLKERYPNSVFLDGDSFREIMGNDLGHTQEERRAVAMQIHRMCKFLVEQDINVVCATMSLFSEIHKLNRKEIPNYFEVFIECDMEELIKRDQKGLYSKALRGEIENVVGVDLPYDKPKNADLVIENSTKERLDEKVESILKKIEERFQ